MIVELVGCLEGFELEDLEQAKEGNDNTDPRHVVECGCHTEKNFSNEIILDNLIAYATQKNPLDLYLNGPVMARMSFISNLRRR
ncbi:hypothetical protein RRG08_054094 [Elysia crispata]|uniref:Uncharacterized protein n=1 Tax=Elysia crispata TaxID=231223 RepID=A0AAE0ZDR2_9GAST|nr:hypothetical protein RRG08_054094 [Elysia crispata]